MRKALFFLVACGLGPLSSPAFAGWTPVITLDADGFATLGTASAGGRVMVASVALYQERTDRLWALATRWAPLPAPGTQTTLDLGFQQETPVAVTRRDDGTLHLARLRNAAWTFSPALFQDMSLPGGFDLARLVQDRETSWIAALNVEDFGCGDQLDTLVACSGQDGACGRQATLDATDSLGSGLPIETVLVSKNPEGGASVVYDNLGSAPGAYQERSLPTGLPAYAIPLERVSGPLAVLFGRTLRVMGLTPLYDVGSDGRTPLNLAARSPGLSRYVLDEQDFPSLAGASRFAACRSAGALQLVWEQSEAAEPPTAIFHAELRHGQWSAQQSVPGTQMCARCAPYDDTLTGLLAACTDSELHVLWSTYRRGLRHTALAPLELRSASSKGTVLRVQGRGFSAGLTVRLRGQTLSVLAVGPRELRVRVPSGAATGRLVVTDTDGETAVLRLRNGSSWTPAPDRGPGRHSTHG